MNDTTPEAAAVQLAIQRRLGPEGRFELAYELSQMTRQLAEIGIRERNPTLTDREVRQELIRIRYGISVVIP